MCSSLICNVLHIHICLNALYINVSLFFAAPHMDPAVVAVTSHPMGHPTSTPQSDPTQISSQTYTNQGFPVASQQKLSQQAVDYSQTFSQSLQSDSLFQSTDNGSSQMYQLVRNQTCDNLLEVSTILLYCLFVIFCGNWPNKNRLRGFLYCSSLFDLIIVIQ